MMTKQDAERETVARWGEGAYAEQCAVRSDLAYQVGIVEQGCKRVRGTGKDWDEALKWAGELEDWVRRGNP